MTKVGCEVTYKEEVLPNGDKVKYKIGIENQKAVEDGLMKVDEILEEVDEKIKAVEALYQYIPEVSNGNVSEYCQVKRDQLGEDAEKYIRDITLLIEALRGKIDEIKSNSMVTEMNEKAYEMDEENKTEVSRIKANSTGTSTSNDSTSPKSSSSSTTLSSGKSFLGGFNKVVNRIN